MKRRNLLSKIACSGLMVTSLGCWGAGEVYKVNAVPGMSTWTITKNIGTISDEITPVPLFNSDVVAGTLNISVPGNYQLVEDLTDCMININTDRVSLDLNQHKATLYSNPAASVIVINGNTQIHVFNGFIQGASTGNVGCGVHVLAGASKITLEDLTIAGCAKGVHLDGVSALAKVTECSLNGLNFISSDTGLSLTFADSTIVKTCNALYSNFCGFELLNSDVNCFYDCAALKTGSDTGSVGTVLGFKSTGGTSNMFQRCVTKQTKTSSTTFGDKACGFLLTGTELKTKIINCIVNETDVVSSPTATTSGIELQPVLQPDAYLLTEVARSLSGRQNVRTMAWSPVNGYRAFVSTDGAAAALVVNQFDGATDLSNVGIGLVGQGPLGCAWSPDGKYVAIGCTTASEVRVYSFNGQVLTLITSIALSPTAQSYCVAWSPNGKFIAANDAAGAGAGGMRIFSFDGATLTLLDSSNFTTAVGAGYVFSWSADGTYIVVGPRANNLIAIPVSAAGKFGTQISVASGIMTGVACSPQGKYVATADTAGNLAVWTWTGSTLFQNATIAAAASSVAWSPDGRYIAVGTTSGGLIKVYEFIGTGLTLLKTLATPISGANDIMALTWSPDGQYIAAARMDGTNSGMVIVRAMYGPATCLIDSCRVADTKATNLNMGRGVAAAGSNVLTRNIALNNGINYSYGIPNTYDGRFEITRLVVQPFDNISLPTTL